MNLNELLENLKDKVIDSIDETYSDIWNTVEDEYLAEDIKHMFYALFDDVAAIFDAAKTPND